MDRFNGIPAIGFGTYPLSGTEAERCVAAALEVALPTGVALPLAVGVGGEEGRAAAPTGRPLATRLHSPRSQHIPTRS